MLHFASYINSETGEVIYFCYDENDFPNKIAMYSKIASYLNLNNAFGCKIVKPREAVSFLLNIGGYVEHIDNTGVYRHKIELLK